MFRIEATWTAKSRKRRARVVACFPTMPAAESALRTIATKKQANAPGLTYSIRETIAEIHFVRNGVVQDSPLKIDEIMSAAQADSNTGFCIHCGSEHTIEPDARNVKCDECGEFGVFGAEELVISMG